MTAAKWIVLTWRFPAGTSTPRVATWRGLQRLGAATLTPGAAVLPYSEQLLEQLEWIAEDIVQRGGEAFVLPVTELREADEEEIRRRMREGRRQEYNQLRDAADALTRSRRTGVQVGRELVALERGLERAADRDYFAAAGRATAQRAIRLARRSKEE